MSGINKQLRVCHFGGYACDYSRNIVLRKSLARVGVQVIECHSRHPSKLHRYAELTRRYKQIYREIDVILVGTVCHYYMPFAFILGKLTRKPVVFDVFDSLYETYVFDLGTIPPASFKARYYALIDKVACILARIVVLDTRHHAQFFAEKLSVARSKLDGCLWELTRTFSFPEQACSTAIICVCLSALSTDCRA